MKIYKNICFLIISILSALQVATSSIETAQANSQTAQTQCNINQTLSSKTANNFVYIFRVKCPSSITKVPSIRAYHKGYRIDINQNYFIINQQSECNFMYLVITDQIKYKNNDGKVQYLERIENHPCSAFILTPQYSENREIINWQIEKENIQNVPTRLPEDALVMLLDPSFVDKLENNTSPVIKALKDQEQKISSKKSIIYLPELAIRQDVTQAQLNAASVKAAFCWIDLDALHIPTPTERKIERERIVELSPIG